MSLYLPKLFRVDGGFWDMACALVQRGNFLHPQQVIWHEQGMLEHLPS
jgi:hypothetical protein